MRKNKARIVKEFFEENPYCSISEAARRLKIDPQTVRKWKKDPRTIEEIEKDWIALKEQVYSDPENNKHLYTKTINGFPVGNSAIDLTGERINFLTVQYYTGKRDQRGDLIWHCKCDCGNEKDISSFLLRRHHQVLSCGCRQGYGNRDGRKNYIGERFGKLTVIEKLDEKDKENHYYYLCKCDCGNIIKVLYKHLKEYISCGCEKQSKGELKINELLTNLSLSFKQEKTFENCKNPKTNALLRFDFYLPDYNCCIEYDGEQHFKCTNSGWNTQEHFEETQYRDSLKNKYCEENSIKLIRIPYTDYDKLDEKYLLELLNENN